MDIVNEPNRQNGDATQHLFAPPSFLHHLVDDEYSRNARSAAKQPGVMITQRGMYCKTEYSLQILANGRVNGTKHHSDKFTVLNFIPVSMGKLYIQGVASGRYLCMNREGRLYGSLSASDECILVEKMDRLRYSTYHSFKYSLRKRKWYVALSKLGKARRGNKSKKRQDSILFMRYMPNYDRARFKLTPTVVSGRKVDNDVRRRRAKERKKRKRLKSQ